MARGPAAAFWSDGAAPANERPGGRAAVRSERQRDGDRAEQNACEWLEDKGLRIVARQVSCRFGELDAVARDGPVLVFVEVRSRRRQPLAAASVDRGKRRRIRLAALQYLKSHFGDHSTCWPACRFDVVVVEAGRFEWIRAAFGAEEER